MDRFDGGGGGVVSGEVGAEGVKGGVGLSGVVCSPGKALGRTRGDIHPSAMLMSIRSRFPGARYTLTRATYYVTF